MGICKKMTKKLLGALLAFAMLVSIAPLPAQAIEGIDGKIVVSGGKELIEKIDSQGYEWLEKEYQVSARKQEQTSRPSSIGLCGAKR